MTNRVGDADHWVRRMYRDADTCDPVKAMSWLTEDVSQQMAGAPPLHGRAAVQAQYTQFVQTVDHMEHRFIGIWDVEPLVTVAEAQVTYFRKDGSQLTLPATTILRRRGDKVADIRIYINPMPLLGIAPPGHG